QEEFPELLARGTIGDCTASVDLDLVRAPGRYQHGERDEAAGLVIEHRPLPDLAKADPRDDVLDRRHHVRSLRMMIVGPLLAEHLPPQLDTRVKIRLVHILVSIRQASPAHASPMRGAPPSQPVFSCSSPPWGCPVRRAAHPQKLASFAEGATRRHQILDSKNSIN